MVTVTEAVTEKEAETDKVAVIVTATVECLL